MPTSPVPRSWPPEAASPAGAARLLPILWGLLGAGCVDQPVCLLPPGGTTPARLLSELGVYVGTAGVLQPAPGFIRYDVAVPLYSDEAAKHRLLRLPPGERLRAAADRWEVPPGTLLVKTFMYPLDARAPERGEQRVETRFLSFGQAAVTAATYLWNADQTDAVCSGGNQDVPTRFVDEDGAARSDHFHVPGVSQCSSCHNDRALGLRTRQLDIAGTYADGTTRQIEHLINLGALDAPPPVRGALPEPQGTAPLGERARAYLDANCAHCHYEDGDAKGTGLFFGLEHTTAAELPVCRRAAAVDGHDRVIVPGRPEESVLLLRMRSPDPFVRMPRGPTHIPDRAGLAVLSAWIAAMAPGGCP